LPDLTPPSNQTWQIQSIAGDMKRTMNRRAENSPFQRSEGEEGCHEEKVHQEWFLSCTRAMWSGVGNQEQWRQSYSEAKQGPDVSNQFPVW